MNESTKNRDFDELMDAISDHDGGNFDVVQMRSMTSSLMQPRSILKGTISDPRVVKLYELAKQMTKEEAATKIENAFRTKLKEYESTEGSPARQHGLHSTLFLVSEFCDRDTFKESLSEWVDWSREQLISNKYRKRYENVQTQFQMSDFAVRSSYFDSNSPELLMTASLILNDQIREGKTEEEAVQMLAEALSRAGWENKLPRVATHSLMPNSGSDSETPLTSIISFDDWGALGSADVDLQFKLIIAARDCLDPPGNNKN
ncbi:MAG: hypothetical protein R3C03_07585 [Pirellulaceae bacterium]